jgi:hypothetical protein
MFLYDISIFYFSAPPDYTALLSNNPRRLFEDNGRSSRKMDYRFPEYSIRHFYIFGTWPKRWPTVGPKIRSSLRPPHNTRSPHMGIIRNFFDPPKAVTAMTPVLPTDARPTAKNRDMDARHIPYRIAAAMLQCDCAVQ